MDLWIRSQDRARLIKCIDITIIPVVYNYGTRREIDSYKIVELNSQDRDIECLGVYKTKERVLEILDEIQGKITQNECLKTMIPKLNNVKGEEEKIGKLFKEMVYEMPED